MKTKSTSRGGLVSLMEDLESGIPVRMLAAPAAKRIFEDFPRLGGWLRAAGVLGLHPVLPYADITLWAYFRLLQENPERPLITSACVGINRRLQKSLGEWGRCLSGVYSPLLCTARYLKKYLGLGERFAFLSPCIFKEEEFTLENGERLIHYNVTIEQLGRWIEENNIDLKRYGSWPMETEFNGQGLTLAAAGGIGKALSLLIEGLDYHVEQGVNRALAWLTENRALFVPMEGGRRPFILELYACPGGCSNGSGIGKTQKARAGFHGDFDFLMQALPPNPAEILALFSHYDRTLDLGDFLQEASKNRNF